MPGPVNFRGVRLGIPICEDIWGDLDICETLAESGAEILLVPNGSPYYRAKMDVRLQVVLRQVIAVELPLVFANQLGGQDELVFDGGSFVVNLDKTIPVQMNQFERSVVVTTWHRDGSEWICDKGVQAKLADTKEADYRACVLGLRDYVNKNGRGLLEVASGNVLEIEPRQQILNRPSLAQIGRQGRRGEPDLVIRLAPVPHPRHLHRHRGRGPSSPCARADDRVEQAAHGHLRSFRPRRLPGAM